MNSYLDGLDTIESDRGLPGNAETEILFHIGPHKTGTTWLQKHFFPNVGNIVYSDDFKFTRRAFLYPRYGDFSPRAAADILAPLVEESCAQGKPIILSDEALGGRAFGQKFYREVIASRIKRVFPNSKIFIASRRQEKIISSLYSEYLRFGYTSRLDAFLDQDTGNPDVHPILDMSFYEWDKTLKFYQDIFGAGSVLMLPMEKIFSDEGFARESIGKLMNFKMAAIDSVQLQVPERPSLSGWAMTALRLCNHMVPQDSRYRSKLGRFSPNSIGWQIDRVTPSRFRKLTALSKDAVISESLGDRFVFSNQSYAAATSIELEALGYKVQPTGQGNRVWN